MTVVGSLTLVLHATNLSHFGRKVRSISDHLVGGVEILDYPSLRSTPHASLVTVSFGCDNLSGTCSFSLYPGVRLGCISARSSARTG